MFNDFIYDIETYPNVFLVTFQHFDSGLQWVYEISDWKNDSGHIINFIEYLKNANCRLVGFNNLHFDYPVIHFLIRMGYSDAVTLYNKAVAIINSNDSDRWLHFIKPSDRLVTQIDLYKIWHFDNRAKSTSLKILEFNMRSDSIQELPFKTGSILTREQTDKLILYNIHDVQQTALFYSHTSQMISFRQELSTKYNRDFMNHNDTKIGKDYFVMKLEESGVSCYNYDKYGRTPRQTLRPEIRLKDAILPWIKFETFEFNMIHEWLLSQVITETKGVFTNLIARLHDFDYVFGLGGLHGSVESKVFESNDDIVIIDIDVKSYYPNIAIVNRFYPLHLTEVFCDIYKELYDNRSKYPRSSSENAMLKLALNGVFGDSNNPFSVFYDPLFTMSVTLNGQLLLCMLIEQLIKIKELSIIQVNTDGVTLKCPRSRYDQVTSVCTQWENFTQFFLEYSTYSKMFIKDVNNYLAQKEDGSIKRKGAYEHELEWHQNHSALVVPKIAEQVLVNNVSIRDTVINWPDKLDFMLRTKVPKTSYLVIEADNQQHKLQNITRYYVSTIGGYLFKMMPPLKGSDTWRKISIEAGRKVIPCNDLAGVDICDIDYEYYINEVEKLCTPLM